MPSSSISVKGGLKLRDECRLHWRLENFTRVVSHPNIIDAQRFEFRVGGNDPKISTCWSIFLRTNPRGNAIGIYYKRVDASDSDEDIYTECSYVVKNRTNEKVLSQVTKGAFGPLKSITEEFGWDDAFICIADVKELVDDEDCTTIRCTFRLFTNQVRRALLPTLQDSLDQFHEKSMAKSRSLFAKLSEKDSSCENVRITTMDNVEVKAIKEMLIVRSPVFEAMFRSNMKEEADGVIELVDLTSEAIRVLLHFIYTGELLPEWSVTHILVQLTNAAAKYQLADLLEFLDGVLPSLCNMKSVKPLLNLAVQLRLKKAEAGILEFVKETFEKTKSGEECLKGLEDMSEDLML